MGSSGILRYWSAMTLSHREEQVAQLVAEAFTVRQIAESLHISEHTVRQHIRSINNKVPGQGTGMKKIMRWVLTGRQSNRAL